MYWYALLLFVANINLYFIIFDSFEKKKHTRISLNVLFIFGRYCLGFLYITLLVFVSIHDLRIFKDFLCTKLVLLIEVHCCSLLVISIRVLAVRR